LHIYHHYQASYPFVSQASFVTSNLMGPVY
jgi:hypothetical protein